MQKPNLIAIAGIALTILAVVVFRCCSPSENESSKSGTVQTNRSKLPSPRDSDFGEAITASLVGRIKYKEVKNSFPPGQWLRVVDPFKSASDPDESIPFDEEDTKSWSKPLVYSDKNGLIVHASFNRRKYETLNLDGQAEKKLRDANGLAIVRAGVPEGVADIAKLNAAMLTAGADWWIAGGKDSALEVEITPVISQALLARQDTATKDSQWVGQEVPMILIKVGYQYGGDDYDTTEVDLSKVPREARIRRTFYLLPYSVDGRTPPPVMGAVHVDEPLLSVWKEVNKGTTKGGSK